MIEINKTLEVSRLLLISKDERALRSIDLMLKPSFFVVLLFLVYSPFVFADEYRAINDKTKLQALDVEEINGISTSSAFDDYDAYRPAAKIEWRTANDSVQAIGGWKAYARDIYRYKKSKQVLPDN